MFAMSQLNDRISFAVALTPDQNYQLANPLRKSRLITFGRLESSELHPLMVGSVGRLQIAQRHGSLTIIRPMV